MNKTDSMHQRALGLMPGGTQLLSKRPQLFAPGRWPAWFRRAKGVEIEDLDGRVWTDVSLHGIGAFPLGYADPDVDDAVIDAIRSGVASTLNCPVDVELAELLCELHPWADQVKFSRTGGEALAVAVRIARAATGRERVAVCGYHGWHDWYIAANLGDRNALDGHLLPEIDPLGVPRSLEGTTLTFPGEDPEALEALIEQNQGQLAAIVMEPARYRMPPAGFLERVRELADRAGAVLVFDEVTVGFRMHPGGLHRRVGVDPDLATFAKGMSNGYAMSAVIGRREVMKAAAGSFISSTSWTERVGPTAALATIQKLRRLTAHERLAEAGERMRAGWLAAAERHGLKMSSKGLSPLPSFAFDHGEHNKALHTLYTHRMLDRGYLASSAFYASLAHSDAVIDAALEATDAAFESLAQTLAAGRLQAELPDGVAWAGLRKQT